MYCAVINIVSARADMLLPNIASPGIAVTGSKVAAGILMLFGYFMTGEVYTPPETVDLSLQFDLIRYLNSYTECGRPGQGNISLNENAYSFF